jgi:hypothetical protein
MLDQWMPIGIDLYAAQVDEAALRITAHRMLDLDYVGAPVGQNAPSCRGANVNWATSSIRKPFITCTVAAYSLSWQQRFAFSMRYVSYASFPRRGRVSNLAIGACPSGQGTYPRKAKLVIE